MKVKAISHKMKKISPWTTYLLRLKILNSSSEWVVFDAEMNRGKFVVNDISVASTIFFSVQKESLSGSVAHIQISIISKASIFNSGESQV